MDKIIFLDIDGVLNSQQWYKDNHHKYKLTDKQYHFDIEAVKRLNSIITITDAKIVISSTWRRGKSIEWFNNYFKQIKLNGTVIGLTKHLFCHEFNTPRGVEIQMYYHDHYNHPSYFEDFPSRLQSYVILDDDADMLYEQRDNFIQTDNRFGLQDIHINQAISILNTELKQSIIKEL